MEEDTESVFRRIQNLVGKLDGYKQKLDGYRSSQLRVIMEERNHGTITQREIMGSGEQEKIMVKGMNYKVYDQDIGYPAIDIIKIFSISCYKC